LVIGNHDRSSGLPRVEHLQNCDTIRLGDLYLQHEPPEGPVDDGVHVVAGHLHPGCTVSGRLRSSDTIRAPRAARRRAVALPMAPLPPAITATRPSSRSIGSKLMNYSC
jgi:metallophosphoesterase superfamily enzyme